jgi:predicted transcriptional regulator|tara:strand:+ start:3776 stop:3991 length:216 start_codon:yes stop_codon:yes gene_type:complete
MPYRNVTSGLQKLRQWSSVDIVQAESEERDSGGIRYRYFPILDIRESDNARADFERACQGQEARYRQNPWA